MMLIETNYELGEIVYLKTDEDQKKRIVKQICISSKGVDYELVNATTSSWHSDFEITKEADILVKTGVDEPS